MEFDEFTSVTKLDFYTLTDHTTWSAQREDELLNSECDAAWTLPPRLDYRMSRLHRRGTCKLLTMHRRLPTCTLDCLDRILLLKDGYMLTTSVSSFRKW